MESILRNVREERGSLVRGGVGLQQVLTGLSARFGMTKLLWACGTAEVVPFPGLALPKSSEGWGRIPLFASARRMGAASFGGGVG